MNYLYRGVSESLDLKNQGKLRPKGNESKTVMPLFENTNLKITEAAVWTITEKGSEINTLLAHQLEIPSHNLKSCLISTTRDREIAKDFATTNNIEKGFIYIIDEDKLNEFEVTAFERVFTENKHEKEVSLRAKDYGDLPDGIIAEKILVCPI